MRKTTNSLRKELSNEFEIINSGEMITGVVAEAKKNILSISIDNEIVDGSKAFSCLVAPQSGDLVSVYKHGDMHYVTNILHRLSSDMQIECDGNMDVKVQSMNVHAVSVNSYVDAIKHFFNSMELVGSILNVKAAILKTFSKTSENNHFEVINKYNKSFTYVEEIEEVHTKFSRHLVEKNKTLKAGNILMTSKDQVKIDGETISLA